MAKRRTSFRFRLPEYTSPRNRWRKAIYAAALASASARRVTIAAEDRLEIGVVLYLRSKALEIHDLDNRLKDILDALQGRLGGPKARRTVAWIVPNDRQFHKVTMTKRPPPIQSGGMGHVMVRRIR